MTKIFLQNKYDIIVIPVGNVPEKDLYELKERLSGIFNLEIFPKEELPKEGYNKVRGQYLGDVFLKIGKKFFDRKKKALLITNVDLYSHGLNFIFGIAEMNGDKCVVSISRLLSNNRELYLARLAKEVVHEIGHTFGLVHCDDIYCVMHFSNSLMDTDIKSENFCERCKNKVRPLY
ncbi:MAG: archaemetzincin family Zn-dependent metalloprotease [Candidatus Thermoplasmatota archaeon]